MSTPGLRHLEVRLVLHTNDLRAGMTGDVAGGVKVGTSRDRQEKPVAFGDIPQWLGGECESRIAGGGPGLAQAEPEQGPNSDG